jgi:predicted phage terminase large subunit-like protein
VDGPLPLRGPHVRFIAASYDGTLSMRDNVKMRNLIRSHWYQTLWGDRFQISPDQDVKTRFNNDIGGFRQSTSVSGLATGEGADILIIDDPHNVKTAESVTVRDETVRWFGEVLPTRLNDRKNSAIVVIMQRVHEADISGYILSRELGYDHVCLPALYESDHPHKCVYDWRKVDGEPLWPARSGFDKEGIEQLSKELGSYAASAQLQQRPVPRSGGLFKREWFSVVDALPADRTRVRAWDLAATEAGYRIDPDKTAGVLISKDKAGFYYVEDVQTVRGTPQTVERMIVNTATLDGRKTRIRIPRDPGQAGVAQVSYLTRQLAGYMVKALPVTGAKETRAAPFAAQCEAGNVRLVRASWNAEFLDELCTFPSGRFDDIVDAASDAFNELATPAQIATVRQLWGPANYGRR